VAPADSLVPCVTFAKIAVGNGGICLSAQGLLSLTAMLGFVDSASALPVDYVVGGTGLTIENRENAAQLLADEAMRIRCGGSSLLEGWRTRRDGGPPLTGARKAALEAYVGIGFKLPGQDAGRFNQLITQRTNCAAQQTITRPTAGGGVKCLCVVRRRL
jgi:hypothetical protein